MAPFQGVWRNYFAWQMNYMYLLKQPYCCCYCYLISFRMYTGKDTENTGEGTNHLAWCLVLRHGWLFFVRQCCHLQADLHINPLHHRKRGVSSLLLGPTIIWLLIIDWFNCSGSKTTVKPIDYGRLRQFNSVPYFAVYGRFYCQCFAFTKIKLNFTDFYKQINNITSDGPLCI